MSIKRTQFLSRSKERIYNREFHCQHKVKANSFMRERKLSFQMIVMTLLSKGSKSLQSSLNELTDKLDTSSVTASAYSQARQNLSHTAFIELNEIAVETMYEDDEYLKFKGYRVLAIDGSKIRLPNTAQLREEFGEIPYTNGKGRDMAGSHCGALASVLYDVFNRIALDSVLARIDAYEGDLAISHIKNAQLSSQDIILFDRGYPSFNLIAECHKAGVNFVIRCSKGSFTKAQIMHDGQGMSSELTKLKATHGILKLKSNGLETEIDVRFVRVNLDNGEHEVLVTSLLDEQLFKPADFKGLYWFRWKIETYYGLLKTRLSLENFTGYSVEAIKQDFYSTIYITSMESILTEQAQQILDERETKHPAKVNRAVSFNAIKNNILDILFTEETPPDLTEKLTNIFLTAPVCSRQRNNPRKGHNWQKSAEFSKWKKKICF